MTAQTNKYSSKATYLTPEVRQKRDCLGSAEPDACFFLLVGWFVCLFVVFCAQIMLVWLSENKILEEVFYNDPHDEIMKKSSDLLKFLADAKLDVKHIDMIWTAMDAAIKKGENATLTVLYKVLDDLAFHLETVHIDFLFAKVH